MNPKHTLKTASIGEAMFFVWFLFSAPYVLLYDVLRGRVPGSSDISGAFGEFYLSIAAAISGLVQLALFVVSLTILAIWWFYGY